MGSQYKDATQYGFRDSPSSAGPLQLACEHRHFDIDVIAKFLSDDLPYPPHFNPFWGERLTTNARHAEDHLQVTGNGCQCNPSETSIEWSIELKTKSLYSYTYINHRYFTSAKIRTRTTVMSPNTA